MFIQTERQVGVCIQTERQVGGCKGQAVDTYVWVAQPTATPSSPSGGVQHGRRCMWSLGRGSGAPGSAYAWLLLRFEDDCVERGVGGLECVNEGASCCVEVE